MNEVLNKVRSKIRKLELTHKQAAREIGVTQNSLERHLSGDYVRSDSLAKYRVWLEDSASQKQLGQESLADKSGPSIEQPLLDLVNVPANIASRSDAPNKPYYVVDLFSGCGGMSLGFDRFRDSQVFRTVLALDIEESTVKVFNNNQDDVIAGGRVARQADLTEFLNESEILAYYLKHLSNIERNVEEELHLEVGEKINSFIGEVQRIDNEFLSKLDLIRGTDGYAEAFSACGSHAMGQTSVIGFHQKLKLPRTRVGRSKLELIIWSGFKCNSSTSESHEECEIDTELYLAAKERALNTWESALATLEQRAIGTGSGQLSSSARKIKSFLTLTRSRSFKDIKEIWADWHSRRESLRIQIFDDLEFKKSLDRVYSKHPVSVLLGGPPCQGFSRIGRGKIRSLREQSVHVHEDEGSVDSRNNLMFQYVLFLSALSPKIFLFENVRHFKAVVKADGQEFYAEKVLEDSIKDISGSGLSYCVSSKIIRASNHSIPQDRERFFMAGVRDDISDLIDLDISHWLLNIKRTSPLPLETAFTGLPKPSFKSGEPISVIVDSALFTPNQVSTNSRSIYLNWILGNEKEVSVDGHIARNHRQDDVQFFELLGPGKRWMDYRCDKSNTLKQIKDLLERVLSYADNSDRHEKPFAIDKEEVHEVLNKVDGSLSLRLLLETIPAQPGEELHHLITPNYLKKREGRHGDWLSRMDPTKPSKTMVSHMSKDTYAYVHPFSPRTISVREAARIQSFPDKFKFGAVGLVDAYKMIGNAVPPLLSYQLAEKVDQIFVLHEKRQLQKEDSIKNSEIAVAAN